MLTEIVIITDSIIIMVVLIKTLIIVLIILVLIFHYGIQMITTIQDFYALGRQGFINLNNIIIY